MKARSPAFIYACLAVLAAGTAHGQARNASIGGTGGKSQVLADPLTEHAAKLQDLDGWLRSLAGKFRLSVEGTTLEGSVDCAGIGAGPGVHCIFSIGPAGQRDRWENAVMLFGIEAEAPELRLFQLNRDSTAEAGVSGLKGNSVNFQLRECPVIQHYPPVISFAGVTTFTVLQCQRGTRIQISPDGRFVRIRQSTAERVLIRRPPPSRQEIREFPSLVNWTLERTQTF